MVLCRFYQQGYCKFGDSCRFEHSANYNQPRKNDYYQDTYKYGRQSPKFETQNRFSAFNEYDNDRYSRNTAIDYSRNNENSRRGDYSRDYNYKKDGDYNQGGGGGDHYKSNDYAQSRKTSRFPNASSDTELTFEDFVEATVNSIEVPPNLNKVWPLSCFGPLKIGDNYPGLEDISPEELRWECLQSQLQGNFNGYVHKMQQMVKNNGVILNSIIQKSNDVLMNLKTMYEGQKSQYQPANQNATFGFSNFSQTSNIGFGNSTQNSQIGFGQQVQFGNTSSNVFQSPTQQQFQQPPTTPSIFGSVNHTPIPPSQSIFGAPSPQNPASSAISSFQSPPNNAFQNGNDNRSVQSISGTFGASNTLSAPQGFQTAPTQQSSNYFYTALESLSEEEMQQFRADAFVLGKIPAKPPPKDFC
ncbi:hypothetical protein CHUAL_002378 [Chamberlinius hualienensis]